MIEIPAILLLVVSVLTADLHPFEAGTFAV